MKKSYRKNWIFFTCFMLGPYIFFKKAEFYIKIFEKKNQFFWLGLFHIGALCSKTLNAISRVKKLIKFFNFWFSVMILTQTMRKSCIWYDFFSLGGQYYGLGQSIRYRPWLTQAKSVSIRPWIRDLTTAWNNCANPGPIKGKFWAIWLWGSWELSILRL